MSHRTSFSIGCGRRGGERGMGHGQGYRGKHKLGQGWCTRQGSTAPIHPSQDTPAAKLQVLKAQANWLLARLQTTKAQFRASARQVSTPRAPSSPAPKVSKSNRAQLMAVVDEGVCSGCGICAHLCPKTAIVLRRAASIDPRVCTGCGRCASECPNQAISLVERDATSFWKKVHF